MKKILFLITMLVVSFAFASCGNNADAPKTKTNSGAAYSEDIIIYSLKDDTLCPILTDNEANRQMLGIVYESLVKLNNNMEAEGILAKSWTNSSDGLSWTFKLREDVKWHSGEKLSPEDVVYTVNQIKLSEGSSYLYNVRNISEMEVSGNSVKFNLSEPNSNFANLMTFPVIKKSEEDVDRIKFVPCGTGAYIFSDKNDGNTYQLLKNENWWNGKAKIGKIIVKLLPDSETVSYSFSSGDIDIANTKWGKKNITGGAQVRATSCPVPVYDFIGINHNDEALKNSEVRKAVNLAVKREKIVNDIFAGNAVIADAPIREEWYVSNSKVVNESDTAEAENLLLKNEWKKEDGVYSKKAEDGNLTLDFEIIVNDDNAGRINIAESIKTDLESVGMKVTVVRLPFEEYENRILTGDYQLFVGSTRIPDDIDLSFLLGEGNMFAYEDETMWKILSNIKLSGDKEMIVDSFGKLINRFYSEMPLVGICFENFEMMYSKKINGELNSTPSDIYSEIYNLDLVK